MAELTLKQETFVRNVLSGVKPSKAAAIAQYSNPHQASHRLMTQANIRQALQARRQSRIEGDLAGVALATMGDLMTGETVPAAQRFAASKWILEHAGHAVPTGDADGTGKTLEELSPDELATAVQSGLQALRELAGQLSGHHIVEGKAVRVLDVLPDDDEGEPADFLL